MTTTKTCKLCNEPVWPNRAGLVRCEEHYHEYMREAYLTATAKRRAERAATLPPEELCEDCGAPRDPSRRGRVCRACYNERRKADYHGGKYEELRYEKFCETYRRLGVRQLIDRVRVKGAA